MKTVRLSYADVHQGPLILVNKKYRYQEGYAKPILKSVSAEFDDILLEQNTDRTLSQVMNVIDGNRYIVPVSGYRSYREQEDIYAQSLSENGSDFTRKFVALPGHSEHQTGFAIDLALKKGQIDFICPDFPYEGICQIFRQQSTVYGFIERYPKGKEHLTEIAHEPWHFRYVGTPHAEIMNRNGLCLEEYIDFIKQFPREEHPYVWQTRGSRTEISYVMAKANITLFHIADNTPYTISGNNVDGYIVTEWR